LRRTRSHDLRASRNADNYCRIAITKEFKLKIKWSPFFRLFILIPGILACNLPSPQEVNAAGTAIALTFQAETAQAAIAQPNTTFTQVSTASLTPAVPATQVPATSTPTGTFFVTTTGANCRSGPSQAYAILTTIPAGTYLTLVGRNPDNSWWYVQVSSSLDCWISNTVGYSTGNPGGLPLVAAAALPTATLTPAAGDTTPPTLNDPVAVNDPLSYPGSCNSNELLVAIRASDNDSGLDSVWLKYRYSGNGGYVGNWHTVLSNDSASGGQKGFDYAIGAEAQSELGTDDGKVEYRFFAKDQAGNTASFPSGGVLQLSLQYCP
jgi:uncharacterized protein YraI